MADPTSTADPIVAFERTKARLAGVRQREAATLSRIGEINQIREALAARLACYSDNGCPPDEWIRGIPDRLVSLSKELQHRKLIDPSRWMTDPPASATLGIFWRAFTKCFLDLDAEGLSRILQSVIEYYEQLPPWDRLPAASAVYEFMQDWRNTECDDWHYWSPVNRYLRHILTLEFAAGEDLTDIDALRELNTDRVLIALKETSCLFGRPRAREVRDFWERTYRAVTALAAKGHPAVSPAAAKWLTELCPTPTAAIACELADLAEAAAQLTDEECKQVLNQLDGNGPANPPRRVDPQLPQTTAKTRRRQADELAGRIIHTPIDEAFNLTKACGEIGIYRPGVYKHPEFAPVRTLLDQRKKVQNGEAVTALVPGVRLAGGDVDAVFNPEDE